jgi:hypothetical protein
VRLAHLSGVGASTTLSHGNTASPLSHGLPHFVSSNAASHALTHGAATNTPTLNGHQANKIVPSPTSNAGMITVLTNKATADAAAAKAATAEAKQDKATAASDARGAAIFQRGADASAKKAAAEAQTNPAQAAKDTKAAAEQSDTAKILQVKADVARLEATAAQDKAKVLTNNAKAEAAAANKLANGTVGNGQTGGQTNGQGTAQTGGQTNGQGTAQTGGQTNGQGTAQTGGQTNGQGQGNTFPGNGFPGHHHHGGGFPGNGGGFAPSNSGITSGATLAPSQSGGSNYGTPPVLQNNPAPQTTALKALALVWNPDGRWVVRAAAQLNAASDDALQACNSQFGSCMASGATVDTAAFGCLGVASNGTDDRQLFAAMGASLDEVRTSLMQQMSTAGVTGQVKYSACNA